MKIVLLLVGTVLIFGISHSADRPGVTYAEYEKQLADYQNRDQELREQISREQATILDVKKRIESSRKNIDDLRRKKLEVLGISPEDVDVATRLLDSFIKDASTLLNLSEKEFGNDSTKVMGCRARLDTLLQHQAYRLKAFVEQKKTAAELVGEIDKRLQMPAAEKVAAVPPQLAPPVQQTVIEQIASVPDVPAVMSRDGSASYVVRKNGDKAETLFDIAQQVYGNAYLWPRIYQANKMSIDKNFNRNRQSLSKSRIADPSDLIYPGQVLVIPR